MSAWRKIGRVVLVLWAVQMIVVAGALARQTSYETRRRDAVDVAGLSIVTGALSARVDALEDLSAGERLAKLETMSEYAAETRKLLYGVIGGVAVQLLISAAALKKGR